MKMIPPSAFIEEVVYTHAVEAAFLYQQRQLASTAPNYRLSELADIDSKLLTHLEGLHLAGKKALPAYCDDMDTEPGDAFVLASVAARHGVDALEAVVDSLEGTPEAIEGVTAALSWLPVELATPIIDRWNVSTDIAKRCMGLGGAICHRHTARPLLSEAAVHDDPRLRRIALWGAGELGHDMQLHVQRSIGDDDPACRYQARRTSLLLSMPGAANSLIEPMLTGGPEAEDTCRLVMRYLAPDEASKLVVSLAAEPETARIAVIGAGAMGYVTYVPWLLNAMETPELARIAMDAITAITGVDIEDNNLDGDAPEGFKEGPTDDPDDDDVEVPGDTDIEWPAVDAVTTWWQDVGSQRFETGERYLVGHKRDRAGLREVLVHGSQRQRAVAAFELAQSRSNRPGGPFSVFDTAAPASRQQAVMAQHGLLIGQGNSDG